MRCRNCGAVNDNNARFCRNCGGQEFDMDTPPNKSNSTIKYFVMLLLALILLIGGSLVYIVYFDVSNVEVIELTPTNYGDVLSNSEIANNIPDSELSGEIINVAKRGVPVFKIGDGEGQVTVISAGVHGDQLVPSIAAMKLIIH